MNRTVFITGASGGIGGAAARLFAQQGDRVALGCFAHPERGEALCAQLQARGGEGMLCQADITQEEEVCRIFNEIESRFGPVQVLVNNAGWSQSKLFTELSLENWRKMMDVHVTSTYLCCKRALHNMIDSKSGDIINVSSMWGQVGASCEVHYSAAKAAVIGLTKALAKEVGPSGIRVNCVAPGVIDTDMIGDLSQQDKQTLIDSTPLERLGTPQDVAFAIRFLASEEASFITGQVLSPNGGFVI